MIAWQWGAPLGHQDKSMPAMHGTSAETGLDGFRGKAPGKLLERLAPIPRQMFKSGPGRGTRPRP